MLIIGFPVIPKDSNFQFVGVLAINYGGLNAGWTEHKNFDVLNN